MSSESRRQVERAGKRVPLITIAGLVLAVGLAFGTGSARAVYQPGEPPAIDPGEPTFTGQANPVPAEGVPYDPSKNMLQAIYDNDERRWHVLLVRHDAPAAVLDQRLQLPADPRPRAVHVHAHPSGTLGFAGGYAYRERPTGNSQSLYTIAVSGQSAVRVDLAARAVPELLLRASTRPAR